MEKGQDWVKQDPGLGMQTPRTDTVGRHMSEEDWIPDVKWLGCLATLSLRGQVI